MLGKVGLTRVYFKGPSSPFCDHPEPSPDKGFGHRDVPEQQVDQMLKVVLGRNDRSVLGLELAELVLDPVLLHLGVADDQRWGDGAEEVVFAAVHLFEG